MKRMISFAAVLLAFCMVSGCSDKNNSTPEPQEIQTENTNAADGGETVVTTIPEYSSKGGTTKKGAGSFETAALATTTTAVTTARKNDITISFTRPDLENITTYTLPSDVRQPIPSGGAEDNEPTEPAEGINGALGRTEDEWLATAQTMYMEACETAFRFLCTGSEFPVDKANLDIIDKTYFLTTCSSFEDATAAYYDIFSRESHGDDFSSLLLEQNGRLYVARGSRGMDMTYLSSQVERLVSISDTEAVFEVLVEYEDREVTNQFSIIAEEGKLLVAEFTLPY